jgi:solute carrier family 25 carnitine/acylcarnitine transporter 20/29
VSHTIRNEGFFALFKGMGSPLLTVPIVNAIVFASYEGSKRYLVRRENDPRIHLDDSDSIPMHTLTAAGAVSGFANSIVVSPVELIKVCG